MGYLHGDNVKYAVPIRVEFSDADKADLTQLLSLRLKSQDGNLVPLSEIVEQVQSSRSHSIQHKDLLPVVYVTGDLAGETDSPLYGLFAISDRLLAESGIDQWFLSQPDNPYEYSLKWDGEWQVTYETFRDMGIAYSVGLLLIYLLVVAQFRSYLVPLVIMAPTTPDHHRHPPRPCAARQAVHRHLDDWHDRPGGNYRAQLHPAGGLHQSAGKGRRGAESGGDPFCGSARQTDCADGNGGDGRRLLYSRRPDLQRPRRSLIFGLLVSTALTLIVIPVVYYAAMCKRVDQIKAG